MDVLVGAGRWITENESLLSGLAALIVLLGVVFSPIGIARRRLVERRPVADDARVTGRDGPNTTDREGPDSDAKRTRPAASEPVRLTLKGLTAPSSHPVRFAQSDGARIAFNERGSGPAALVIAPGILSHLTVSENLPVIRGTLDALAGFARVVAFDKRGQGLSDPSLRVPDLEQRSRDIGAVMDAAGLDRAHLLAFSEGGPMALHFAWRNPARVLGLILVGTAARFVQSDDYPIGIARRTMESIPAAWGRGSMRRVLMPSLTRETMDDETYAAMERLIAPRETVRQLMETMIETDVRSILPEIRCRALVLHFVGDLAIPIRLGRALAEGLPEAEFVEVNSVDHADLSQSPEAIERIRAFCDRTTPSDRADARRPLSH